MTLPKYSLRLDAHFEVDSRHVNFCCYAWQQEAKCLVIGLLMTNFCHKSHLTLGYIIVPLSYTSVFWIIWPVEAAVWLNKNIQSFFTHWGWVVHISFSKLTIVGWDNDLWPGRCQPIIWTNAGILLIGLLGTNFNESLIKIHTFSLK